MVGREEINEEQTLTKKKYFSISIAVKHFLLKTVALDFLLITFAFDYDSVKQIVFTEVFSFRLFSLFQSIHPPLRKRLEKMLSLRYF